MIVVNGVHVPDDHHAEQVRRNPLVFGAGAYRWAKVERALELVPRRSCAIDIGAHAGLITRVLGCLFKRVHAFEPVPDFIQLARLNTGEHANVEIYPFGLGESEGWATFTKAASGEGTASITAGGPLRLALTRLDGLSAIDAPDFVKVSCEGAEHFAILGAERTIRAAKPVILIEQKRKRMARYGLKAEETVSLLALWGAEVIWSDQGDFCLGWRHAGSFPRRV